ncbi:MAG: hypothetical protein IT381_07580 [Deltaproteobacteria bacterium]|nr:hypothetical protein [Deltaproteobacteria bacterium]
MAQTQLILADIPERNRLRELVALLNEKRDDIAALDLEIETLQYQLGEFEARYRDRLYDEHRTLKRIESLVRHFERWCETLREAILDEIDRPPPKRQKKRKVNKRVLERAKRIQEARARELENRRDEEARREQRLLEEDGEAQQKSAPDRQTRLKAAYRSLARRYHPDLARQEDERVRFGAMMTKINELYRQGDLERLELLATQAKGGEIDEPNVPIEQQIVTLEARLRWFTTVHENMIDERRTLEASKTCQLLRDVEQAEALGRDLVAELKAELQERALVAEGDVRVAVRTLESEVNAFNRKTAGGAIVKPLDRGVGKRFDPYADKALVRFALEELEKVHFDGEATQCAEWVLQIAESHPPLLRALLFAYVADLSQFPLPGLERYDDIKLRFDLLEDERCKLGEVKASERWTFERALVEGDQVIEFGPKQASEKVVRMGLKLRNDAMRHGMLLALRRHAIRREFKRVLSVLGEKKACAECQTDVYTVPLYRLRGLDALRALVCPHCATTLHTYWMPRGDDVQAVLNVAFIDFEIIHEWSFGIGKATVATQLTTKEQDDMTVGELKKRLHADVFRRNNIEVTAAQVWLEQDGDKLPEKRAIVDLGSKSVVVRFASDAGVSVGDALELLKHRIRTRFSD